MDSMEQSEVDLVIRRVFDAPRDLVYRTMTESEHLQHWWGPKECTIEVARNDVKPGGIFHYRMMFEGGFSMWGRFLYRELTPPSRIVFINGFADEAGNAIANPMAPNWPMEMLITLELAEQDGKTALTLVSTPLNATELERATFLAGHLSMQGGFGGMYDKYEAYLSLLTS